jgi:hypothetical protein
MLGRGLAFLSANRGGLLTIFGVILAVDLLPRPTKDMIGRGPSAGRREPVV